MSIAIVGAGAVGSAFAFQLSRAGHDVTVVARGKRLLQLEQEAAIVTVSDGRAKVRVSASLDVTVDYDLVLVTVQPSQVDALLAQLEASAARSIMFMFNYFGPLARLRNAVSAARFAFGFPAVLARLEEGRLVSRFFGRGVRTTVTAPSWAEEFGAAGIPCTVEPDMEDWLHTHAVFMVPVLLAAALGEARGGGVSLGQARHLARALDEGFRLVRELGHAITPAPIAVLSRMPVFVMALFVWMMSRVDGVRRIGASGVAEARWLIDAMARATRRHTPALRSIRPSLLLLALLSFVTSASASPAARIHVEVANLEGARGQLLCTLFSSEAGFPSERGMANVAVPLTSKTAACDFEDLAPGAYAVSVLHDENMDGKLNKNLFGVPKEGYGVSNNHTYALSSPKWSESTFSVAAGEARRLAVTLRY